MRRGKLEDPPEERPWTDRPGPQRIAASKARYSNNLIVWTKVGHFHWARALIDSGCTGNFMSPAFARKHYIRTGLKKEPFPLAGFDGKPVTYNNGIVSRETQELPLEIGRYLGKTQFDITEAPGCNVVLGLPWLRQANLVIDWSSETI